MDRTTMQDMGDSGISVPVIFFDGEKEIGIGDVLVSASFQFRDLQLGVGQRIGLSPNQFSVFFFSTKRKRQRSWPRKLQITANFNFSSITGSSEESYFLVVLKRSRRERAEKRFNGFEKVVLLRREEEGPRFSSPSGFGPGLAMELWKKQQGEQVLCNECVRRRGTDSSAGFHWCVNDVVTAGFRSRAGPITRPVKNEMFRF